MPIKPENKSRYPSDWNHIRETILKRANNCCEQCKAQNRTRIARGAGPNVDTYQTHDANVYCANTGEFLGRQRMSDFNLLKMVDIVLTIAHLDHVPENCDPANLKALCQRCHLRYDAQHHAETARATRKNRRAMGDLFS